MMRDARFLSILLAVAVPVSAWLAVEYMAAGNQARQPLAGDPLPPLRSVPQPVQIGNQVPPAITGQAGAGGIRKCIANGVATYTDQPCSPNAVTRQVNLATETAGLAPNRSYRSQLAAPLAEIRSQGPQVAMVAAPDPGVAKDVICKQIDDEVKSIDARLRQPYYPQEGDWWKDQRKAAMDRRFSAGC
jgi:hypothetical protein